MFTLIGIVIGFACLSGLLSLIDHIAINRGLGGAHPLSPAIAYALLAGTILLCICVLIGLYFDYEAALQALQGDRS